jgi:hypothetical protein
VIIASPLETAVADFVSLPFWREALILYVLILLNAIVLTSFPPVLIVMTALSQMSMVAANRWLGFEAGIVVKQFPKSSADISQTLP